LSVAPWSTIVPASNVATSGTSRLPLFDACSVDDDCWPTLPVTFVSKGAFSLLPLPSLSSVTGPPLIVASLVVPFHN
jgi:hypothetical protein